MDWPKDRAPSPLLAAMAPSVHITGLLADAGDLPHALKGMDQQNATAATIPSAASSAANMLATGNASAMTVSAASLLTRGEAAGTVILPASPVASHRSDAPTALQKAPMAAGLVAISFLGFLFFILILVRAAMRHHLRLRELRRGLDAEKETPGDAPRAS